MIRRGTSYGPILPEGVLEDDGADRGIIFIFAGASLKRQFEFVKTQWLNDGIFIGAPAEKDPLVGPNDRSGTFTIPTTPIRRRLQQLPPFVITRGGEPASPDLRAMRWLAQAGASPHHREHDRAAEKRTTWLRTPQAPTSKPSTSARRHPISRSPTSCCSTILPGGGGAVVALNRQHQQHDHRRDRRPPRPSSSSRGSCRCPRRDPRGAEAFSVGSDLRQRGRDDEGPLARQRQLDRTCIRCASWRAHLRRGRTGSRSAAVAELAQEHDFIIASTTPASVAQRR